MTCSRCGAADAGAIRDTRALCLSCAEVDDWSAIIDIAQGIVERPAIDLAADEARPAPVPADPFA